MSKPTLLVRLVLNWDGKDEYSSAELLHQNSFRLGLTHWIDNNYGPMVDDEVSYLDYIYMLENVKEYGYLEGYKAGYYEVVGELSIECYQCNCPLDPVEYDVDVSFDNVQIQELTEEQASIYFDEGFEPCDVTDEEIEGLPD